MDSPAAALCSLEYTGGAAIATGIARAALEHATTYADQREQFGRRIRQFQGIRMKLADMKVRTAAAAALLREAAVARTPAAAAGARVFASESAMWVTTQAVQIFGGYGYMRDYPVEKTMRDAKATEVLAATNEALRETVAAALYPN
jgi:alkylation response protein AidB-like acyl-CoA dehydrogenase